MYKNKFTKIELEKAVMKVKTTFVQYIEKNLNLLKVSSPLFLDQKIGLNDHLTGDGQPVSFQYKKNQFEIIQSLAKWKRQEIKNLEFSIGEGLWTNMKAIRTGETKLSPYHSLYVEQFDWEKRISKQDRTVEYLKQIVEQIYESIKSTLNNIQEIYPFLTNKIPDKIIFITTEELYKLYPELSSKERENKFARESKAFFLLGIGHKLSHNKPHDDRAPDYDDWNLNGDLILYNGIHDDAMELSSMGIRVDAEALKIQNKISNNLKNYDYHINIKNENLPFTIGGGIGQSRLVLFILEGYHIGEFQRSFWPKEIKTKMANLGIQLK